MKIPMLGLRAGALTFVGLLFLGSCFAEPGPRARANGTGASSGNAGSGGSAGDEDGSSGAGGSGSEHCVAPVKTPETLVPRGSVLSAAAPSPEREVLVPDLFRRFKSQCGACHVEANQGKFQMRTLGEFLAKFDEEKVFKRIESNDPKEFMPPPPEGIAWSDRKDGDPVKALDAELRLWVEAEKPADVFFVKNETATGASYALSPEVGANMTNLGTCVPESSFPYAAVTEEMDEKDAFFAGLAKADPSAGVADPVKLLGLPRFLSETDLVSLDSEVLARRGVVAFAPTYALWSGAAGKLRYVRVPRGQSIRFDKQTQQFSIPPNTRFYKTFFRKVVDSEGQERWRKIETRIIVARPDLEKDGQRVPSALFGAYRWNDEETEAELVTTAQRNLLPFQDELFPYFHDEPLAQMVRDQDPLNLAYEYEFQKALKYYAIPGKERCIQCHMGSQTKDFVLGFVPLQIKRRPCDAATLEERGMCDGGVYEATGEDEVGQFQRLVDLGVITGGTAADVVPLENAEGDRKPRNDLELRAQAYMIGNCSHCHNPRGFPSTVAPELAPLLNFFPSADGGIFQFPLERYSPRISRGENKDQIAYITPSLREIWPINYSSRSPDGSWTPKGSPVGAGGFEYLDAPWRSLIFRNVQTPFTYADDFAIFPHMPMNTPGYDCRAPRFLGSWMVSIPGKRKHPELNENLYPVHAVEARENELKGLVDRDPQPYIEVKPGEAGYDDAARAAEKRLRAYQAGPLYAQCLEGSDLVDHSLFNQDAYLTPQDTDAPPDGIPNQPHWVVTDLTERPGAWAPRRSDWEEVLKEPEPESVVVQELRSRTFQNPEVQQFLTRGFPLGVWKEKPNCRFQSTKKVTDFADQDRPKWIDISRAIQKTPTAPVYEPWPGQAVFDMICTNCHGRQADSRGRQAETIQLLTGGETRVANLRDGLFGPPGNPGTNMAAVFGPPPEGRDWAARYMAWMGLGGTQRRIPDVVLSFVALTDVVGTKRKTPLLADVGANMLAAAQSACLHTLPGTREAAIDIAGANLFSVRDGETPLILTNGDAELWQRLCALNNPAPIRRIMVTTTAKTQFYFSRPSAYPPGARIGNHRRGFDVGYDPTKNFFPWCVLNPNPDNEAQVAKFVADFNAPLCPPGVEDERMTDEEVQAWTIRGAANAGFAVFEFLSAVTKGQLKPVRYDECELLQ